MIRDKCNKDNLGNMEHSVLVNYELNSLKEGQPLMRGYEIFVDDNFHYMDETERWSAGKFATYKEALTKAKKMVEDFFTSSGSDSKQSAEDLVEAYQSMGDDPCIAAFGGAPEPKKRFSAWSYAKQVARRVAKSRKIQTSPRAGQ